MWVPPHSDAQQIQHTSDIMCIARHCAGGAPLIRRRQMFYLGRCEDVDLTAVGVGGTTLAGPSDKLRGHGSAYAAGHLGRRLRPRRRPHRLGPAPPLPVAVRRRRAAMEDFLATVCTPGVERAAGRGSAVVGGDRRRSSRSTRSDATSSRRTGSAGRRCSATRSSRPSTSSPSCARPASALRAEQLVGRDVPDRAAALPVPRLVRGDRDLRRESADQAGSPDLRGAARAATTWIRRRSCSSTTSPRTSRRASARDRAIRSTVHGAAATSAGSASRAPSRPPTHGGSRPGA